MAEANKVALVTGASRGIGSAIASKLAQNGFTVVGTATTSSGAENITANLSVHSSENLGYQLDVTDANAVDQCLKDIGSKLSAPLILVNNAGITRDNLVLRMKSSDWDDVIATNLTAVFHLTKAVMRGMMKARWGRILNISSVVARMGNAGQGNYVAAKSGMEGFTRAMAMELAPRTITVNAIAPGFIETDMTAQITAAQKETLLEMIPLGRMGHPDEVAALAVFLCQEVACYITGETIHVNGGLRLN